MEARIRGQAALAARGRLTAASRAVRESRRVSKDPAMRPAPPRWLAAVVLACLAASATAGPASVIRRSLTIDPPSLDPSIGTGGAANPVLADLVEGLVGRAADGSVVPGCAETWTASDDGLEYRFRLRRGLQWSDGTALTADDFVYSFRRLMDPATGARAAGFFLMIDGAREVVAGAAAPDTLAVSAPDAQTVRIRLVRRAPYFPRVLANTQAVPVPRHVIERHGRDWTRAEHMVSNGPYRLAERVPQTLIRLERNPRFHAADAVSIDEVQWRPVQDMGAALRAFRAGDLDVVLNAPPDAMDWIRENMPEALHVTPVQATYHLVFNVERAPFGDARVRRALSLAVDREAIADRVLGGSARPAVALVTPGAGGYAGIVPDGFDRPMARRQARARALLAEAGFGPERPLTVPVVFDSQEENRKVMVAIAGMWREIGVRAVLDNVEGRALIGRIMGGDFAVARSALFALYDDPYAFLSQLESGRPSNRSGYANSDYDALLAAGNAAAEADRRLARFAEAEALLMREVPVLPIYWFVAKVLVAPRVQGWEDAPLGTPPTRWLSLR